MYYRTAWLSIIYKEEPHRPPPQLPLKAHQCVTPETPTSQAVRKVLAKLKYSVLYKAESGFPIITDECLTFRIVYPKRTELPNPTAP